MFWADQRRDAPLAPSGTPPETASPANTRRPSLSKAGSCAQQQGQGWHHGSGVHHHLRNGPYTPSFHHDYPAQPNVADSRRAPCRDVYGCQAATGHMTAIDNHMTGQRDLHPTAQRNSSDSLGQNSVTRNCPCRNCPSKRSGAENPPLLGVRPWCHGHVTASQDHVTRQCNLDAAAEKVSRLGCSPASGCGRALISAPCQSRFFTNCSPASRYHNLAGFGRHFSGHPPFVPAHGQGRGHVQGPNVAGAPEKLAERPLLTGPCSNTHGLSSQLQKNRSASDPGFSFTRFQAEYGHVPSPAQWGYGQQVQPGVPQRQLRQQPLLHQSHRQHLLPQPLMQSRPHHQQQPHPHQHQQQEQPQPQPQPSMQCRPHHEQQPQPHQQQRQPLLPLRPHHQQHQQQQHHHHPLMQHSPHPQQQQQQLQQRQHQADFLRRQEQQQLDHHTQSQQRLQPRAQVPQRLLQEKQQQHVLQQPQGHSEESRGQQSLPERQQVCCTAVTRAAPDDTGKHGHSLQPPYHPEMHQNTNPTTAHSEDGPVAHEPRNVSISAPQNADQGHAAQGQGHAAQGQLRTLRVDTLAMRQAYTQPKAEESDREARKRRLDDLMQKQDHLEAVCTHHSQPSQPKVKRESPPDDPAERWPYNPQPLSPQPPVLKREASPPPPEQRQGWDLNHLPPPELKAEAPTSLTEFMGESRDVQEKPVAVMVSPLNTEKVRSFWKFPEEKVEIAEDGSLAASKKMRDERHFTDCLLPRPTPDLPEMKGEPVVFSSGETSLETECGKWEIHDEKLEALSGKLETDLGEQDTGLGKLDTDIRKLDSDLGKLDTDIGKLDTDLGKLDSDLGKLDTHTGKPDTDCKKPDTESSPNACLKPGLKVHENGEEDDDVDDDDDEDALIIDLSEDEARLDFESFLEGAVDTQNHGFIEDVATETSVPAEEEDSAAQAANAAASDTEKPQNVSADRLNVAGGTANVADVALAVAGAALNVAAGRTLNVTGEAETCSDGSDVTLALLNAWQCGSSPDSAVHMDTRALADLHEEEQRLYNYRDDETSDSGYLSNSSTPKPSNRYQTSTSANGATNERRCLSSRGSPLSRAVPASVVRRISVSSSDCVERRLSSDDPQVQSGREGDAPRLPPLSLKYRDCSWEVLTSIHNTHSHSSGQQSKRKKALNSRFRESDAIFWRELARSDGVFGCPATLCSPKRERCVLGKPRHLRQEDDNAQKGKTGKNGNRKDDLPERDKKSWKPGKMSGRGGMLRKGQKSGKAEGKFWKPGKTDIKHGKADGKPGETDSKPKKGKTRKTDDWSLKLEGEGKPRGDTTTPVQRDSSPKEEDVSGKAEGSYEKTEGWAGKTEGSHGKTEGSPGKTEGSPGKMDYKFGRGDKSSSTDTPSPTGTGKLEIRMGRLYPAPPSPIADTNVPRRAKDKRQRKKLHDYACAVCHAIFSHPSACVEHVESHVMVTGKSFLCGNCRFVYPSAKHFTSHKRIRRVPDKAHNCEATGCGKSFSSLCWLKRHCFTSGHFKRADPAHAEEITNLEVVHI